MLTPIFEQYSFPLGNPHQSLKSYFNVTPLAVTEVILDVAMEVGHIHRQNNLQIKEAL